MLEYPKMIYKTREVYKIVQDESELKQSLLEGYKLHWLDNDRVTQIDSEIKQIDEKIEVIKKKKHGNR